MPHQRFQRFDLYSVIALTSQHRQNNLVCGNNVWALFVTAMCLIRHSGFITDGAANFYLRSNLTIAYSLIKKNQQKIVKYPLFLTNKQGKQIS